MDILCDEGWLSGAACGSNRPLAYEVTDQGWGWYYFHHHHFHVSFDVPSYKGAQSPSRCLIEGCEAAPLEQYLGRFGMSVQRPPVFTRVR